MRLDSFLLLLKEANILQVASWRNTDVVWRENGVELRRMYVDLIGSLFKRNKYKEILLPAFIPVHLLEKQYDHNRDVKELSFLLEPDSKCYLRATSESQFAAFVAEDRNRQLPIRLFQSCTVFRREQPNATMPLLRGIEVDPFVESITFGHSSSEELRRETKIYQNLFDLLCLPIIESQRPSWDTFPEAVSTHAFDTFISGHGMIQVASVHNLSTSFAKTFNLRDSNSMLLQETSSGISGRALLAVLMAHFHNNMFFLPSSIAPRLISVSESIKRKLGSALAMVGENRILINNSSNSMTRGFVTPLQINSISRGKVKIANAFGHTRICEINVLDRDILVCLQYYDMQLRKRANLLFKKNINTKDLFSQMNTCTNLSCLLPKASQIGNLSLLGFERSRITVGSCTICNKPQDHIVRFAKTI